MDRLRSTRLWVGVGMLLLGQMSPTWGQEASPGAAWPGLKPDGAVLLPNGWSLEPAGRQTALGDFPIRVRPCPTEPVLAVLHAGYGEHEVLTLDGAGGTVLGRVTLPQSFGGLAWSRDGKTLYVGGGADDVIYRFDHASGLLSNRAVLKLPAPATGGRTRLVGDLAVSGDGQSIWVSCVFGHTVCQVSTADGSLQAEIALEDQGFPYCLALDESAGRLYASLWGLSQVAVLDTRAGTVGARWDTQEHPNEMLLLGQGKFLFVANANRNTVSVFQTGTGTLIETINTAIAPMAPVGSTPNALGVTPDEKVLFVANANTNDVAVLDISEPGRSKPLGLIPAGWYPTSLAVAADGKRLFITNGKGSSSRANRDGPNPLVRSNSLREYIGGLFRGTLSTVEMPSPSQMAVHTRTVYRCSPLSVENPTATPGGRAPDCPVPGEVGKPSPIRHCVYIIKENRTYDQVLGDMPRGNGDPALCLFGERVTPNHHALADQFVLLDNFYVESEVSADGHEWSMAAYATDYVERTWPLSYRGDKRYPYPSEGGVTISKSSGGYIWDKAREKGVTYFSFGEFITNPTGDQPATTSVEALQGHFDPQFMGYNLDYTDQKRADRFLEVLGQWEQKGEMPSLVILRLPNDHTYGTRAGKPTPTAMVGDNDLALGRVVEGLSRSRFWPELAIFVVEDDAQNGSDHVDAHRTVALAISPYITRGNVDSTLYSTSSMLRTMELCLGLDPMSQFDAAARPMWASFTAEPDLKPYTHLPAQVDLNEMNLPTAWGAELSETLDLTREDAADDLIFNEIIWRSVKGADSPMPAPVRAVFVRPVGDDDEAEEHDDD